MAAAEGLALAGLGVVDDEDDEEKFINARWISGSFNKSELLSSVPQWMRSASGCFCAVAPAFGSGADPDPGPGSGTGAGVGAVVEVGDGAGFDTDGDRVGCPLAIAARLSALPENDCRWWRNREC